MSESMRKILYYENILEFKENTQSELNLREVNNWQLCRTCLAETKEGDCDLEKMCVMDALEGRFLNVKEMLTKVTAMQLSRDDDLPPVMCKDCLEKLTVLYYFSMQVHRASKILKKLSRKLKGETETDNEDVNASEEEGHNSATTSLERQDSEGISEKFPSSDGIETENNPLCVETSKLTVKDLKVLTTAVDDLEFIDDNAKEVTEVVICGQRDVDAALEITPTKIELCESPDPAEGQNYSEEHVEVEEHLDDIENSPPSPYVVDECDESRQTDIESEEIGTTVEVYLKDELIERLAEKDTPEERTDDDMIYLDESSSSSCTESIKILKTPRFIKTTAKGTFKHKQTRVTKPLLESTKCAVCQEVFKRQRDLVAHVRQNHPNSKAFQCRECNQLFSHTQSLSRHMNTHKPMLKKNTCSYCSKAFLRPDDLTRHIRTHTGERPYGCPMCEKAFKQQGEMKQHLATHMKRKKYECPQCDKVLASRNSLYAHKKTHIISEGHPFKCSRCPRTFPNNKGLLCHERQHGRAKNNGVVCDVVEM